MKEITIDSFDSLSELLYKHNLKPADTPRSLCINLIEEAYADGHKGITFTIASYLLPKSYTSVPAMFAKSIAPSIPFPYATSSMLRGIMTLTCSSKPLGVTFTKRAINAVKRKGKFTVRASKIPKSYRHRPQLIATMLMEELHEDIAIIAKRDKITWKIA